MWELDYKESWALKYWCFWTVVLEKTLEIPLDCEEIKPVNLERKSVLNIHWKDWPDAEAEAPILWPHDTNSWLIRKDPDAVKDWREEEKVTTDDEMAGCHHQLNGHEFEQALRVGHGQGSLACCSSWARKETGLSNWIEGLVFNENLWEEPYSLWPFHSNSKQHTN